MMRRYKTPFGTVTTAGAEVVIRADADKTYAWAHRPGAHWPGSQLSGRTIAAHFFGRFGDLIDVYGSADKNHDLDANELNAWSTDCLHLAFELHAGRRSARGGCGMCGDMATLCAEAEMLRAAMRGDEIVPASMGLAGL